MSIIKTTCSIGLIVAFAGCTQIEAPQVIQGQPLYDKLGNQVGCERGMFIPGAQYEEQCLPPDEQCEPIVGANNPDCPPPGRDPNGGRDPNNPGGNNPDVRVVAGRV